MTPATAITSQPPDTCSGCESLRKKETKTFNRRWEVIKIEFDFHYCGEGMRHRLTPNEVLIRRPTFCPRDNDYLHIVHEKVGHARY